MISEILTAEVLLDLSNTVQLLLLYSEWKYFMSDRVCNWKLMLCKLPTCHLEEGRQQQRQQPKGSWHPKTFNLVECAKLCLEMMCSKASYSWTELKSKDLFPCRKIAFRGVPLPTCKWSYLCWHSVLMQFGFLLFFSFFILRKQELNSMS